MRLNFNQTFEKHACLVRMRQKSPRWSMLALRDLMRPVGEHNLLQPVCPICSRPLRLTRTTAKAGDVSELRTYGCTGCGVWLTEAADDSSD
jgi:hypothetical protein